MSVVRSRPAHRRRRDRHAPWRGVSGGRLTRRLGKGFPGRPLTVAAAVTVCVAVAVIVPLVALTGSSGADQTAGTVLVADSSGTPTAVVYPEDGAVNVSPGTAVSVVSPNAKVVDVQVTGAPGAPTHGTFGDGGHGWYAPPGLLGTNVTYTVSITLAGSDGRAVMRRTTFTTAKPATTLQIATMYPSDGETVGIGMPIILKFNAPVTNKDAVQNSLEVLSSPILPGAWHWFSDTEVHYRPENYWPTGEHVSLLANLAGVDAGNGVWGLTDRELRFTVGEAHVSTVDTVNHTMTVTDNGKVVNTFPISAGRDKYPTMNGVHFVWWKQPDVLMDSATVGIPRDSPDGYYEHVYQDVAISTGGEYVHSAPWSVSEQGSENVSHGCVNLAPDDAAWFYQFSQVGDVVQVTGSPRPPDAADGVADWNMSWSDWTATPGSTSGGAGAPAQY